MSQNNLNISEENALQDEAINLRHYWHLILERRWLVLASFIVVLILTALYLFSATAIYSASARLQIDRETENSLRMESFMMDGAGEQDYLQTQYKNLKSRSLIEIVLERTLQNVSILDSIKAGKRSLSQIANETQLQEEDIIKRLQQLSDAGFFGDEEYAGGAAPKILARKDNSSLASGLFVFPPQIEEGDELVDLTQEEQLILIESIERIENFKGNLKESDICFISKN